MKYEVWENLAHKYNNLWVQKYSLGPTRREVLKIVLPLLKENNKLNILDIGCGTGQLIKDINNEIEVINYLGIDVSENMIKEAQKANKKLKFKTIPIEKFNSKEKFDIVICTHAFPYFPDKESVIQKIHDITNNNATIIIANSSTNSLKDLLINFFLKATTSKATYLSIDKMKELFTKSKLKLSEVKIIREKKYMPTIALFHVKR